MNLAFRENYWDAPELKSEYMRFLVQLFRVDLSIWDEAGFWDPHYRPFSYFSDNSLVANVSVYSMEITISGQRRSVAQISAVGTVPEYRRRGLALDLTRTAMEWARNRHDFFFLFADEDAFSFYKQCGFRPVQEHKARISLSGKVARPGAVRLDMRERDHIELVYRLASNRAPVSDVLGVFNSKLFMFWCLTYLNDCTYYIPELNLLVLLKREAGLLTIYDIVGTTVPTFAEIYPYIGQPSDRAVDFLFMVDKMNLEKCEFIAVEGNDTHVLGDFPLEGSRFLFPYTAHA
ncbi:MAG: GNAT family N-acetyltransferase [Candidatus Zixiibacteriota bacterium]